MLHAPPKSIFFEVATFGGILYAPRMPADPFARSVFIRSLYSRSLPSKRHANAHTLGGGDQGTQRRGPRGAGGGARADARCARARADARAARAGALRAPGPLGGPRGPLIRNKSDAKRNR